MLKYERIFCGLCLIFLVAGCSDDDSQAAPEKDAGGDVATDTSHIADAEADAQSDAQDDAGADADATAEPAAMRVTPAQIFFEDVEIGQTAATTVRVANVGGSPLYINNASLTEGDPENEAELKAGAGWPEDGPLELAPGTHTNLEVIYEPVDHATDRGFVTINGTDPENSEVVVPIETINSYPDIDVLKTLRFGTVAVGESATEEIVVHNRGLSPLTVDEITMAGDSSFSLAMQSPYETPAVIERDDYIIFEVTYAPSDDETDQATITIDSNDPDQQAFEIGVVGNEPTPCIRVSSKSLEFAPALIGTRNTESLTILNCSQTRQLEVSNIALSTDGGGVFSINQAPQTPVTIPPMTTEQVQVAATGTEIRDAVGVLVVESNDPQQGGLVVEVRASFFGE